MKKSLVSLAALAALGSIAIASHASTSRTSFRDTAAGTSIGLDESPPGAGTNKDVVNDKVGNVKTNGGGSGCVSAKPGGGSGGVTSDLGGKPGGITKMDRKLGTGEKKLIGFAAMTPERRREISSQGGRAAHASGNAHKWTSKTASAAAKKKPSVKKSHGPAAMTASNSQLRGGVRRPLQQQRTTHQGATIALGAHPGAAALRQMQQGMGSGSI